MLSDAEQASMRRVGIKIYPVGSERAQDNSDSSVDEVSDNAYLNEHDMMDLPRRVLSNEETASVTSVMTGHYLDQIKDREERESARRNIEYLREQGFIVRGHLLDGKYLVKFSTPTKVEVMTLKSFIKAKFRRLVQHQ